MDWTSRIRRVAFISCIAVSIAAAEDQKRLLFTGTLVSVDGTVRGTSRPAKLVIEGITPDEDITKYIGIAEQGGQDALLKAIEKLDLGFFQYGTQLGKNLNIVRIVPIEGGGQRVTALYARDLRLFELRQGTRSEDYPFTFIQVEVDKEGKGKGEVIGAARIRFAERNEIYLENYAVNPLRLISVRLKK
jgi:hypothetical protein